MFTALQRCWAQRNGSAGRPHSQPGQPPGDIPRAQGESSCCMCARCDCAQPKAWLERCAQCRFYKRQYLYYITKGATHMLNLRLLTCRRGRSCCSSQSCHRATSTTRPPGSRCQAPLPLPRSWPCGGGGRRCSSLPADAADCAANTVVFRIDCGVPRGSEPSRLL